MGDERGIGGEQGAAHEPARAARTNLFIAAVLEWGGGSAPVTVRNLSETGALIEGAVLPLAGIDVRLVRGSLVAAGTVAWAKDRRCGLTLSDPVPVALWMAKPGNVGQAEIDAAVRRIKAGQAIAALPPTAAPDQDLAASIRALEAQLDAVSEELASDSETVARHAEQLQTLDLLAQGLARLRGQVGG